MKQNYHLKNISENWDYHSFMIITQQQCSSPFFMQWNEKPPPSTFFWYQNVFHFSGCCCWCKEKCWRQKNDWMVQGEQGLQWYIKHCKMKNPFLTLNHSFALKA